MTRDGDEITVFVFSSADNAIAFGNTCLQHHDDAWITNTHDRESLDAWLRSAEELHSAKFVSVDPGVSGPFRVIPISVMREVIRLAP